MMRKYQTPPSPLMLLSGLIPKRTSKSQDPPTPTPPHHAEPSAHTADALGSQRLSLTVTVKVICLSGHSDSQPEGEAGDARSKMGRHTCGRQLGTHPLRLAVPRRGLLQIYLLEKRPD